MTTRYTVTADPLQHLFTVTMTCPVPRDTVDLSLPVWTPGSYMVREYSRHLQDFTCPTGSWQKINKNTWRIQVPPGTPAITVQYRIYALELTVRTSHLDTSHAYFNGACLFLLCADHRDQPHTVHLIPPVDNWQIATSLTSQGDNVYLAQTYDELVDSPVEMGHHAHYDFTVLNKPHHLVIWGRGNCEPEVMIPDMTKIIETTAEMFGGLPYPEYWFLLHLGDSYGGLEHHNSTSLLFPRLNFKPREKYEKFLQLVAHEFFHCWNVKRLRPVNLDRFDYSQENYVSVLWFCEGATAYYDELIGYRCGFYDATRYLNLLSDAITRLETTPGRTVQSLAQSSFDAWIKLYRPDENSLNSSVSYYLKGQVVLLLLDLQLRLRGSSLDLVVQKLWQTHQQHPYTEAELWATIEAVAGEEMPDFYQQYIQGTAPLPYDQYLAPFGLQLTIEQGNIPYTGIKLGEDRPIIKSIETTSPAQRAGLCPGDELVALDGYRVTSRTWNDLLKYIPDQPSALQYFRRDELQQTFLQPGPPLPVRYNLVPLPTITSLQQARYQRWLSR
ncbi:M61 family metallopeptidase [Candidatus Cyanaurora vandensis]|uniref:M61 family metallopeptidase n=1 Tax=Candidatus Cyanaurora vandensis TaxID=2714958 RepID=UPI00257A10EF|nr:PDZ domain-containing protein [Candidatus Cyanaurora vandensis]